MMKVGWLHGIHHVWIWRWESLTFVLESCFVLLVKEYMNLGVDITKFSSRKTILEFLEESCQFTRGVSRH